MTPVFPPMPLKRRTKLESCLRYNVGDVFWMARGVTKKEVEDFEETELSSPVHNIAHDMDKTLRIWQERLIAYDDAFNLAFTPDSEALLNGEKQSLGGEGESGQSRWDCVQEGFLRFFTSMLRDYGRFINKKRKIFKTDEFLNAQPSDCKPFLKEFLQTQHFDSYITKVMYTPKAPDVIFFDQSIIAKKNRSKMTLRKKRTPFLHSAKAQKQLRTIDAAQPSVESNYNLLDQFYANASALKKKFSYPKWPESLDETLLKNPRRIPDVIAAEFDRRSGNRAHQNEIIELDDFQITEVSKSIEVTAFSLFFQLTCDLLGHEFQVIKNKHLPSEEHFVREERDFKSKLPDCSNVCTFGQSVSSATVNDEYTASFKRFASDNVNREQLSGFANELIESEFETAKLFAFAEIDLAFSVLETLFARKLKPTVDALKSLMTACGRCDCSQRATQLMTLIHDKGVHIDSETYYYFVMNAPLDGQKYRKDWLSTRVNTIKNKKLNSKRNDVYLDGSDSASNSEIGSSFQDNASITSLPSTRRPPRPLVQLRKKNKLIKREDLSTTDQVERHIVIGDSLLTYLYKDLEIDLNNATCQSCGTMLGEDQVRLGWHAGDFTDKTTKCPFCRNNFVPSFVVKTNDANFVGSQGKGTPLHCEFLSPWFLHKAIHNATRDSGLKVILDPVWRNGGDKNSTIWWNLVVTFQRHKLPITFLLQGSFEGRLIMPMPE